MALRLSQTFWSIKELETAQQKAQGQRTVFDPAESAERDGAVNNLPVVN